MPGVSNRSGAMVAVGLAVALSGCANVDFETDRWFAKPLDLFGRQSGYTYSELQETRQRRPITANELVQQNGGCPPPPASVQAQIQASPAAPNNLGAPPAGASDADSLMGGGIALGMSECAVVYRAGPPTAVQLGQNPNGDRTAVLSFDGGPHAGVYRFRGGRLLEMDRAESQPAPPQTAKNKPAKTKKAPKSNDQS